MNSRNGLLTRVSEGDDESEEDGDTGEIGSDDDFGEICTDDDSGEEEQDEEVTTEEGEGDEDHKKEEDTVLETAADLANELYG